jgi:hypothetical protein
VADEHDPVRVEARTALDASRCADRLITRELLRMAIQRLELKTNLKTTTQRILPPSFYGRVKRWYGWIILAR